MKKVLLLVALAFMFLMNQTAEAYIYRSAVDGRKDGVSPGVTGYKTARSVLFGGFIYCSDPGETPCPSGIYAPGGGGTPLDQVNEVNWALSQIQAGILSATVVHNGINVEWTSVDNDATTSEIRVWYTTESRP